MATTRLLASSASSNQKREKEEEEETKEDIEGRFLDEYMKNAEVDPTLVVSLPDRTLTVSRGKIPAFSTNIYRKSSNDEEAPASLVVAAGSMSSQSQRGVSVASDYSMLSFGSVLSDEEDQPEDLTARPQPQASVQPRAVGFRDDGDGGVEAEQYQGGRQPGVARARACPASARG